MAEITSKKKKTPQKTAMSWEELLIEKVLAMILEKERQINESAERFEQQMKEKNRQINESAERFEQQMKENAKLNDREMGELTDWTAVEMRGGAEQFDRRIKKNGKFDKPGRFSKDSIGYIDLPNLMQSFHELGFTFERSFKDATIKDKKNNIYVEIDITLEGNDKIMIVETAIKPTAKDITGHIERMRKVRRYGDLHGEKRKYLGAISGKDFNESEKLLAMKNGFYVIEHSGETFIITAPKGIHSPVEW
jgi:exonuclease VII large subunit